MTAFVVSLGVFVVLLIVAFVFVGWRDRNRLSSPEDSTAVRRAGADQTRQEAERHFVQGQAAQHHTPNT